MAIKSSNWFMDSSYYDNYKDYERIYEEYKDFFKKYGIDINSVRELGWNPMIFEVLKRHYDYNHNRPKNTGLDVSKLVSPPSINSILGGVLTAPKGNTPSVTPPMAMAAPEQEKEVLPIAVNSTGGMPALPISGMYDDSAVSTDTNEPSGKVVVGPDTEVPAQSVRSVQPAQPVAKPLRRAPKPKSYVEPVASTNKSPVVNNTPVDNTPIATSNVSIPVAAPTLSSVTSQAIRHNGGFDNYRRESVLSALRAAGGISPAEAVQRGIIPWEALNYV